jgi:hypothetical protein
VLLQLQLEVNWSNERLFLEYLKNFVTCERPLNDFKKIHESKLAIPGIDMQRIWHFLAYSATPIHHKNYRQIATPLVHTKYRVSEKDCIFLKKFSLGPCCLVGAILKILCPRERRVFQLKVGVSSSNKCNLHHSPHTLGT